MKVFVIGSGGREHALTWKIARSKRVSKLFCAPGNPGMAQHAECIPIAASDIAALAKFAQQQRVDLTVVGPEDPLAAGIVDHFRERGLRMFGPTRAAAQLEASKVFAKQFCLNHNIPTARAEVFDNMAAALAYLEEQEPPIVVKADGLAQGKGVTVAHSRADAQAAVLAAMEDQVFGEAGRRVIIEQFLEGREVSLMALCDGEHVLPLESAADHKAAYDDDHGPNTGGMGCYSPVPRLTHELHAEAVEKVLLPTVEGMRAEGRPYVGVLYAGLILTPDGLQVLEFNCRFGDPETQVIMPRLKDDLVDLIEATLDGSLNRISLRWSKRRAVCVIMASGGYPRRYEKGRAILGIERAGQIKDVMVFHAGTAQQNGKLVTSGGRVLGVTALGRTFRAAATRAYQAVSGICFDDVHYRKDIARRVSEEEQAKH